MLVMTRKVDEAIVVGEGPAAVVVTVLKIEGDRIKLGIEGDRGIPVHRVEVYDALVETGGDLVRDRPELAEVKLGLVGDEAP